MIKVEKYNLFKVLKPEQFIPNKKLLGKYKLSEKRYNEKNNSYEIRFIKDFGEEDDFKYCTFASLYLTYNENKHTLKLFNTTYGGMCGFSYDESDIPNEKVVNDRECMIFTVAFIKELIAEGIIDRKPIIRYEAE